MPRNKVEKIIKGFGKGTVNFVESELIEDGAASESRNFITDLDRIFLTYGRRRLGDEYAGSTPVLGLSSITKLDGTDLIVRKIATRLQYYNPTTDLWVDMKTGLDATSEMFFDNSYTPAGRQLWGCGLDGLFKIYPSFPTDVLSLYNSAKNFKGPIRIEKSRMLCWNVEKDATGLKMSKIDRDSNYKTPSVQADSTVAAVSVGSDTIDHSRVTISSVDTSLDTITFSTPLTINTGDEIYFTNSGGGLPAGLTAGVKYFAYKISSTVIKVCTTLELAIEGITFVDLTSGGSGTNYIIIGAIDFQTGDKVVLAAVGAGSLPTGLTAGVNYWVRRISANKISLATSYANAVAGTIVDITVVGTGAMSITTSAEFIGVAGGTNYSGTLKKGQVFGVSFYANGKKLTDNKNGGFTGDGTGTINYATGAYSITFSTVTTGEVSCVYLYEDPTNGGLADFTYTAPTRLAAEGVYLRQDSTGTKTYNVITFDNKYYSLQDKGTFRVTIDATDVAFVNDVFNATLAGASAGSSIPVSDGIIYVDVSDPAKPKLRKLSYNQLGDKVIPYDLSEKFSMEDFAFDKSAMALFGNYVVFTCREKSSAVNNKTIFYHILNRSFDVLDNGYNYLRVANNMLYGGDSASPNVYELFSGFDDLDFTIEGEWVGKNDDMETEQIKKNKYLLVEGYIGRGQGFTVLASPDRDDFIEIGSLNGDDAAVTAENQVTVGSRMYAEQMYGGEGDGVDAFYFKKRFKLNPLPKFQRLRIRLIPTGIGYLAFTQWKWSDIRYKGFKTLKKYK